METVLHSVQKCCLVHKSDQEIVSQSLKFVDFMSMKGTKSLVEMVIISLLSRSGGVSYHIASGSYTKILYNGCLEYHAFIITPKT